MNCQVCQDKGIVTVNWADAPHEYAVCLCATGQALRSTSNFTSRVTPLWVVWAAREGVNPSAVWMIEDVLTGEELTALGLFIAPVSLDREAALLAAGRSKGPKL